MTQIARKIQKMFIIAVMLTYLKNRKEKERDLIRDGFGWD
jgi:hypothetical protein